MKLIPCLLALVVSATSSSAQSINVDFGMGAAPSSAYGAASGQNGVWAAFNPSTGSSNVPDVNGAPTGLHLNLGGNLGFGSFDEPATGGDDELLMDDYVDVGAGPAQTYIYCLGLDAGLYDVYVYAWNPSDPGAQTGVEIVIGAFDGPAASGGVWPGGHAAGVTYTKHSGYVPDTIIIIATALSGEAVVNGIQFVQRASVGTSYCSATPNSSLSPASIAGHGSASVQANDLTLVATSLPAGQPGLFYYGLLPIQTPFGNGFRCVDVPFGRLPVGTALGGVLVHALDNTTPPTAQTQITPGSTWYFQAWFRDPVAGGAFFDLSDGLQVTFGT
jgi:hypothetical protein